MIDELIGYYQRELSFFRESAGAFADAHPKIASRLRLTREAVEDPHIGRLVEAVALLNARLRHKIEDEFPEISDALLLTLFPHLIQPIPSFFVLKVEPGAELAKPVTLPRATMLSTAPIDGEALRYRTGWDLTLMPLRIRSAALGGLPLDAPPLGVSGAKGVLRLSIGVSNPDATLAGLEIDTLRLYINADARRAQLLIEQFGVNLLGIGVGTGPDDRNAVLLPSSALRIMGMTRDEVLLPQDPVSSEAYAIIQEHFAYPQKHHFIELSGLSARTLSIAGDQLDLFFYLDRCSPELERAVRAQDFELFATPAINLFPLRSEPIQLNQTRIDYRVIPDARREHALEVHSITDVTLQDATGERKSLASLHAVDHSRGIHDRFFYAVSRKSSLGPGGGDDLFLAVADLDGKLLDDDGSILTASTQAMNRELPLRLPFGGGLPALSLDEALPGAGPMTALTKPTPTRRPARRRSAVWKLVGQLSLNHLSFTGGPLGAQVLRELLALYDLSETPESTSLRDRLISVSSEPGIGRVRMRGHTVMCAGTDVTIEVDDRRLSGSGSFLLTAVLERFLATACSLNSFVRVTTKLRGEQGPWKSWQARVGDRQLL